MKTICIDYDGTYTCMTDLLDCIIDKAHELGYYVVLATMRHESETNPQLESLMAKVNETIFTGRVAKLPFLLSKGIKPDLWIDDNPVWLFENSI